MAYYSTGVPIHVAAAGLGQAVTLRKEHAPRRRRAPVAPTVGGRPAGNCMAWARAGILTKKGVVWCLKNPKKLEKLALSAHLGDRRAKRTLHKLRRGRLLTLKGYRVVTRGPRG